MPATPYDQMIRIFFESSVREGLLPSPAASYISSMRRILATASSGVVGNGAVPRTASAKAESCSSKVVSPSP
eukprot:5336272-Pleurochrysis_carterae.AAC.3